MDRRTFVPLIAAAATAALAIGGLTVVADADPEPPPAATPAAAITSTDAAATVNVVYLTFDDGPHPTWTPQVLAVLAKYKVPATFFAVGRNAKARPDLIHRVKRAGHTVGAHSVTHPNLTKVSALRRHREIFGGVSSTCFRPPYGATNAAVRADIKRAGMRQMLWHVDPRDWSRPGASVISQRILSRVRPGSIVLMHDGGGDRSQTVASLSRTIRALKARGYVFRALSADPANCRCRPPPSVT